MKIQRVTPVSTGGSMLAYLDKTNGLVLPDLRLMRGPSGVLWVAMPVTKEKDRDGNPILNEKGRPKYREHIRFRDGAVRQKFTAAVLEALRREHPDVLG